MKSIEDKLKIKKIADEAVRLYFEKDITIVEAVEEATVEYKGVIK